MKENISFLFLLFLCSSCNSESHSDQWRQLGKYEIKASLANLETYSNGCNLEVKLLLKGIENGTNVLNVDINGETDYQERLYYYSYNIEKDLKIQVGEQLYNCNLSSFERRYHISDYDVISAFFHIDQSCSEMNGPIKFSITNPYFNAGIVNFLFDNKDFIL